VNETGEEDAIPLAVEGKTGPWLQDVEHSVWTLWNAQWRDVIVLDEENRQIAVFNVFEHSLGEPENYEALRAILLAADAD
jgi:hypothetical protein